jgi:hypothetical protein
MHVIEGHDLFTSGDWLLLSPGPLAQMRRARDRATCHVCGRSLAGATNVRFEANVERGTAFTHASCARGEAGREDR